MNGSPRLGSLDIPFHGPVNFILRANTDIEDKFAVRSHTTAFFGKPAPRRYGETREVNVPITAGPGARESPAREGRYAQASRNCIEPPATGAVPPRSLGALPGYARPAFAVNEPLSASTAAGVGANPGARPRRGRRGDGAPPGNR